MWAARLRHSGLGILLLGVTVALLLAWRSSHVLFAIFVGFILLVLTVLLDAGDGWRQASRESLTSRGIRPDSVRGIDMMDPGLRRDMVPTIPVVVTRRMSGTRTRRPAARSAAMTKPARSGQTRRRNESLQPDATVTLAGERRAAGIYYLFFAPDSELSGLVPVKKKREEIFSLRPGCQSRQRFRFSASPPTLHIGPT